MSEDIPPAPSTRLTRRVFPNFSLLSSIVPLPIRTFARLQARTKPAHTTKQDITAWLSTSTPTDPVEEMSEDGEAYELSSTRAPDDWPRSLSHLTHALLSSSTTSRVHFLRHDLLPLAQSGDLSLSQTLDLFRALTLTYPRYADSASRTAVEDVGTELVKRDAGRGDKLGIAEQIAGWVGREAKRVAGKPSGHASGSILVLLSWAAGLYTVVLHADGAWSHTAATLLGALAALLDAVLGEGKKTRGAVRKAAEARARRALRSAPAQLNDALDALRKGSLGLSALPLLCIAISDTPSTLSPDRKGALLNIYTTSVLGSARGTSCSFTTACIPTIQRSGAHSHTS